MNSDGDDGLITLLSVLFGLLGFVAGFVTGFYI